MAPITARSASKSCGGTRAASAPVSTLRILPRRSITYQDAAKRPPLQDGSLDLVVQILPVPTVEANAACLLDGVGDVGGRDRTEEPLVLAGAGLDGDHALVEDAGDLLRPLG